MRGTRISENGHQRDAARRLYAERVAHAYETGNRHACAEKSAFPDLRTARINAQWLANKLGVPVGAYKCPVCRQYHLTHRTDERERERHPEWVALRFVVEPAHATHVKPTDRERIRWWCERHRGVTVEDMSRWTRLPMSKVRSMCPPWFLERDDLL